MAEPNSAPDLAGDPRSPSPPLGAAAVTGVVSLAGPRPNGVAGARELAAQLGHRRA
ncbi:MAG TPA: hypothetical protein VGR20_12925 [Acidimicrobiia bacterium]|nr:hypothetical protein [Acidimicrobiia bacterium]